MDMLASLPEKGVNCVQNPRSNACNWCNHLCWTLLCHDRSPQCWTLIWECSTGERPIRGQLRDLQWVSPYESLVKDKALSRRTKLTIYKVTVLKIYKHMNHRTWCSQTWSIGPDDVKKLEATELVCLRRTCGDWSWGRSQVPIGRFADASLEAVHQKDRVSHRRP